jgi:uracil-DNA glycosylase family 4
MNHCKDCGRKIILPEGPVNADILLVGDAPTTFDVKAGRLWTGPGGDVLRVELRRAGINMKACRVTNLWLHAKHSDCAPDYDAVLEEMSNRRAILLMGADATTYFTGENVSDVSGLRVDEMDYAKEMLPEGPVVYASVNPALALHDKLGEVRFSMTKFAEGI